MPEHLERDIKDLMIYRLQRAKEDLEAANVLVRSNSYLAANNRIYYAVFHAVLAVQSDDNLTTKKHGQIIGEFNKNYVKTNKFSRDIGRKIKDLQNTRHSSDYDDFYIADKNETKQNLKSAKEIVGEIEKFIEKNYKVKLDGYGAGY